ncbi:MAG TPA: BatA and WFA domain-containing protein [Isosphaeraceae bacterium]|nr:BatA and WFA domain-containing protein [Isosphaeraceae bacterium]
MNIALLGPGLAAGMALAAIPVILHLFMKQKPRHVIFPALRLIKERHKRSRKKLKIKNWLLLAARMAVVALMALALARPALYSQASLGDREVPTALALVFDTSLSMQYTEKNETRLAEAKKYADEILRKTVELSRVFVIDSAEPGVAQPVSPSAARKRVQALQIRPANRPLNLALGQAYRAVAESENQQRHEVYVFTDLARSSWDLSRPADGLEAQKKVKLGITTYVLRLTPKDAHDLAVVEAEPSASVATQGDLVDVKARVRASGEKQSTVVEFFLDKDEKGNAIKRNERIVEVPADGEVEVNFKSPNLTVGLHQGEVRVRGSDPMEFDDHRYFSFQVQPSVKVLLVAERRIDWLFVAQALDPVDPRFSSARPYHVEHVTPAELETKIQDNLRDHACVFLLNVKELPESSWSRLNAYLRDGGGVVIGLGDRANPENYNGPIASQVVPAALDTAAKPKEPVTFGKTDINHPLFSRYTRELEDDLVKVPVVRYWTVKPAQGTRTILAYDNGAPALVERAFQGTKTGRVLMWTTPLSRQPEQGARDAWNEFPLSDWSFLYLMFFRTVPYMAGLAGEKLNYEAGQDVVIPLEPSKKLTTFVVQGPDKKTSDRLTPQVSTPSLVIQSPQALGQWTVAASAPGRTPENLGFSINPPVAETQVKPLDKRDLDGIFGKAPYALADDPSQIKEVVMTSRVGREMFPWIMVLILMVVTLENLLANKFYRENQQKAA